MRPLLAALALIACSSCTSTPSQVLTTYSPASFERTEDARQWAGMSAPQVYAISSLLGTFGDAGCPVQNDNGTTLKVSGNCTDAQGTVWSGTATFERTAPKAESGTYSYQQLTSTSPVTCPDGGTGTLTTTFDGTVKYTGASGNFSFDVDLRVDAKGLEASSCTNTTRTSAWAYQGTSVSNGNASTWNGSGKAGSSNHGVASVETKNELIDHSVCASEAASGTTTAKAGTDTLVITYDGAFKCDMSSTVKYSVNGTDKGELTGVACGAVPGQSLLFAALVVLLTRRRTSHHF